MEIKTKQGFTITCNKCGEGGVQVFRSGGGVCLSCTNLQCEHDIERKVTGYDENGFFTYKDEILN